MFASADQPKRYLRHWESLSRDHGIAAELEEDSDMASNGVRRDLPRRQMLAGGCGAALLLPVIGGVARAEKRSAAGLAAAAAPDVLEAEAEKLVEVKYIPNDSRSAQIVVKNISPRPVTLRLPQAFVGVPVLAQMGMMGGMGGGMGGRGGGGMGGFGAGGIGGGGMQSTGGGGGFGGQGMNGMGMGGMNGGMGGMGGAFSIPPERTRVARIQTVCLEYAKDEPNPRMTYRMQRVDSFTSDPRVAIILASLGLGELPQKVAQAATWHIANGLSWQQLAAETIDHLVGADERFFSPAELAAASRVVARVEELVGQSSSSTAASVSPGSQG